MIVSLCTFSREERVEKHYGENKEVYLTIKEPIFESNYESRYEIYVKEINGERINRKAILSVPTTLKINDELFIKGEILPLENINGYDEKSAYLDDGIFFKIYSDEIEVIEEGNNKAGIFKRLNLALSSAFERSLSKNASGIFKALLLGNKSGLDPSIERDFSRIGISHLLALSGLHITLITGLLGLLISFFKIPRVLKGIILILSMITFTLLTGFSPSCVRAAIMMCLFWLFSFVGHQIDKITSLFLSVSLVVIFSPYLIFSLSMQLSFLAMLGCLSSYRYVRKIRLSRKIKSKALRRILSVLIASIFIIGFTFPLLIIKFSSISLLTPISNLIFIPIFTGFIYFAPFLLLISFVPYVSVPFVFLANVSVDVILYVVRLISSVRLIYVPIYSFVQILGAVIVTASLILLIFVNKKGLILFSSITLSGLLVFFIGCGSNAILKATGSYVSAYSENGNDYVLIEGKGTLSFIDVSKSSERKRVPGVLSAENGYTEIENYVLLDYSSKSNEYLDSVLSACLVRNLYLPAPKNEDEIKMNELIKETLEDERTNIYELYEGVYLSGYEFNLNPKDEINRSERRAVSFTLKRKDVTTLYLGSATYELLDYFASENAYTADIIIFGSYGPTYHQKYFYEMRYLDAAIYLGNSYDFATDEHKNATQGKDFRENYDIVRIKIKSP